jgi:hypothetical protein
MDRFYLLVHVEMMHTKSSSCREQIGRALRSCQYLLFGPDRLLWLLLQLSLF